MKFLALTIKKKDDLTFTQLIDEFVPEDWWQRREGSKAALALLTALHLWGWVQVHLCPPADLRDPGRSTDGPATRGGAWKRKVRVHFCE